MSRRRGRREALRGMAALAAGAFAAPLRAGFTNAATPPGGLRAQRLAWAGVRLQLGEDTLFLDPLTSPDVWAEALPDRLVPLEVGTGARYVLITHRHPDHFDRAAATQALGAAGTLVCAPDAAPSVAAAGFRTRPAPLYEPQLLGEFTATAVPAVDGYGDPQVSWVVAAGGRRVIHCGDSLWHGSWWHIARQLGPFDAAFLPINGARFGWRKPVSDVPAVLTPEQAVAATVILGARLLVPIHYGMKATDAYAEVPDPIGALREAAARRRVDVQVLAPGEWVSWAT